MNALKILLLLAMVYAGIYTTTSAIHIALRTWTSYRFNKQSINEQGLYGLRLLTKFCLAFILILIQTVSTLIWDLYREDQFPMAIRIPITALVLYLSGTAVIPVNFIISGVIDSILRVHKVEVKVEIEQPSSKVVKSQ